MTGHKWDLANPATQNKVRAMVRQHRPRLLILSPPCTAFTHLQNLNGGPKEEDLKYGTELFNFAVEMAKLQMQLGSAFMLEHPMTSNYCHSLFPRVWSTFPATLLN